MLPDIHSLNPVHHRRPFLLPWYFCYLTICPSQEHVYDTCQLEWRECTNDIFPLMAIVQYMNVFPRHCANLINFLLEISMAALFLTADVVLYTQEYNWKRYMYILQEALGHRCQNDLRCLANLLSFDLLQGKKISPAIKKYNLIVIPAL